MHCSPVPTRKTPAKNNNRLCSSFPTLRYLSLPDDFIDSLSVWTLESAYSSLFVIKLFVINCLTRQLLTQFVPCAPSKTYCLLNSCSDLSWSLHVVHCVTKLYHLPLKSESSGVSPYSPMHLTIINLLTCTLSPLKRAIFCPPSIFDHLYFFYLL